MGNESSVSETKEKYHKLCINFTDKAQCLKEVWRFCDESYDKETNTASCNSPCYLEAEGIGFKFVEHETDFNCLLLLDEEFLQSFYQEYEIQNSKDPYGLICKGHDPNPNFDEDHVKYSDCSKDIENILRNCKTCDTKKCKDEIWTYMESSLPILKKRFKENVGLEDCDQLINFASDSKCFPNYTEERENGKLVKCIPNFHSNERILKFCEIMEIDKKDCMEYFEMTVDKCLRNEKEKISLLPGLTQFDLLERTLPHVTCAYVLKQAGKNTLSDEEFNFINAEIDGIIAK